MGKFNLIETGFNGLYVIESRVFEDSRGFFMETYHKEEFFKLGLTNEFIQDNHSKSSLGVLRGLHFQKNYPQGKLVRVINGEVFDVAVDFREDSETYGKWYGLTLSSDNKLQFYIPEGFAHGFLVTSEEAEFCYKCTDYYHPDDECGILWNDKTLNIDWPINKIKQLKLSEKDKLLPNFVKIHNL